MISDMLFVASYLLEDLMSEYYFFKKGKQIIAVDSMDIEKKGLLAEDGWEKLFEEVRASDAEEALSRLSDMRKEEEMIEHSFIVGSAFSGLLRAILK